MRTAEKLPTRAKMEEMRKGVTSLYESEKGMRDLRDAELAKCEKTKDGKIIPSDVAKLLISSVENFHASALDAQNKMLGKVLKLIEGLDTKEDFDNFVKIFIPLFPEK